MGVCDAWFAESLLCALDRRRGVVLGIERMWPSDAFCFVFEGGCFVFLGKGGGKTCICG